MPDIVVPDLDIYQDFTVSLGNVSLKVPTVQETFLLAGIVKKGLFPGMRHVPVFGNWYDDTDTTASARRFAGDVIADWGAISPRYQHLHFAIMVDGNPVGRQSIMLESYTYHRRKDATTGSWIAPDYRTQGVGQKARWMILALAFQQMTADQACTAFLPNNTASQRISETCGYVKTGYDIRLENGKRNRYVQYTLTRAQWEKQERPQTTTVGFDSIAEKLGLS